MPKMDGLEVLNRLKENPSTSSIPVILLTEKVDDENVMVWYKRSADFYIPKPFTSTQLMTGINLFLSGDQGQLVGSL